MKFDPDRHHRRSIRLPGYDYGQPGAYFVTICTYRRECTLGVVRERKVLLSVSGNIVEQSWCALSDHFLFVELDTFVIMPNHLHGIIIVKDYDQKDALVLSNGTRSRSVGSVVQNFKSVSTRKVNQVFGKCGMTFWQRGYYERIVRDDTEWNSLRQYIASNPERWTNNE